MRRLAWLLLVFLLAPLVGIAQSPPEIPYTVVPDLLKLPPNLYLGEVPGVAVDKAGNIYVYTRSGCTRLLEFAPDGRFIRELGHGLYSFVFAHGVRIDPHGNIWTVDEGSNMIVEFSPDGRVLMNLGRRPEPSQTAPGAHPEFTPPPWMFNRETDIAWDSHGNMFVTDGYGNSRVAEFDKDGMFVKAWGSRGTAPGQFHTPHTIAIDANNNIYVGDRENNRIQVFDDNGTFLKQWTNVGAPWAICITPGPNQVLYSADGFKGRFYKLDLNGNILGEFGKRGKINGTFGWIHEIDCSQGNENIIYAADMTNWRVDKIIMHPAQ